MLDASFFSNLHLAFLIAAVSAFFAFLYFIKIFSCFSGLELIPLFTPTFYHLFNFIVDPRVMLCP